ncbi:MAG: cytochrome o ubiquinol oxidase subunit IV [Burkholderia sp.]|nr:cytochrome o ubiquinol oxidase subunit IV [Burkholderia sp.]
MVHSHSSKFEAKSDSISTYISGFIISVVLTSASFSIVLCSLFSAVTSLIALSVLALIQIIIHLVYFLHINRSSDRGWNLIAFVYILLTGLILILGTTWIMYNAKIQMM